MYRNQILRTASILICVIFSFPTIYSQKTTQSVTFQSTNQPLINGSLDKYASLLTGTGNNIDGFGSFPVDAKVCLDKTGVDVINTAVDAINLLIGGANLAPGVAIPLVIKQNNYCFGSKFSLKVGAGFDVYSKVEISGGSIDVKYPVKFSFDYPQDQNFGCGDDISIATSFEIENGNQLSISPPTYKVRTGVSFKEGLYLGGEICAFTCNDFSDGLDVGSPSFEEATETNFRKYLKNTSKDLVYTSTLGNYSFSSTLITSEFSNPFGGLNSSLMNSKDLLAKSENSFFSTETDPLSLGFLSIPGSNKRNLGAGISFDFKAISAPIKQSIKQSQSFQVSPTFYTDIQLGRTLNWAEYDGNVLVKKGTSNVVSNFKIGHTLKILSYPDNNPTSITPTFRIDAKYKAEINQYHNLNAQLKILEGSFTTPKFDAKELCKTLIRELKIPEAFAGPLQEACSGLSGIPSVGGTQSFGPFPDPPLSKDFQNFKLPIYSSSTTLGGFGKILGTSKNLIPDNIAPEVVTKNIIREFTTLITSVKIDPRDVISSAIDKQGGKVSFVSVVPNSFDCSNIGDNVVKVTVQDDRCNQTTVEATVTIVDNEKPKITARDITIYLDKKGQKSIVPEEVIVSVSDNCGIATMALDKASFTCADVGINTVKLTVFDNSKNSEFATVNVLVVDDIKPTVLAHKSKKFYLDAKGELTIAPEDIDNGSFDNCGIAQRQLSKTNYTCADVGINEVVLTITDVNKNASSITTTIEIIDDVKPTVLAYKSKKFYLDAKGELVIAPDDIDNGSFDNCGIAQKQLSKTNYTCADVGINEVTLTITDVNKNASSITTTIEIIDDVKPTVLAHKSKKFYLDAKGELVIAPDDIDNGSFDNCGIAQKQLSKTNYTCADVGINEVVLTITDVNKNASSITTTIEIIDDVKPTVVCQNLVLNLDNNGKAYITAEDIDNGSWDNCGIASLNVDRTEFGLADYGVQEVVLTAIDVNGNQSSCRTTVEILPYDGPTIKLEGRTGEDVVFATEKSIKEVTIIQDLNLYKLHPYRSDEKHNYFKFILRAKVACILDVGKEFHLEGLRLRLLDVEKASHLEIVNCENVGLNHLLLGGNKTIKEIDCSLNNILWLDITGMNNLISVNAWSNSMIGFYSDQDNSSLLSLDVASNKLTELNLSYLSSLGYLSAASNQLSAVDLSKLHHLEYVDISSNKLTNVTLRKLQNTGSLNISNNAFVMKDIPVLPADKQYFKYQYQPRVKPVIKNDTIDVSAYLVPKYMSDSKGVDTSQYIWMTEVGDTMRINRDYVELFPGIFKMLNTKVKSWVAIKNDTLPDLKSIYFDEVKYKWIQDTVYRSDLIQIKGKEMMMLANQTLIDPKQRLGGDDAKIEMNDLMVFPNPGRDYIRLEHERDERGQIFIYDNVTGSLVLQSKFKAFKELYTGNLKEGKYTILYKSKNGKQYKKQWIKVR